MAGTAFAAVRFEVAPRGDEDADQVDAVQEIFKVASPRSTPSTCSGSEELRAAGAHAARPASRSDLEKRPS